MSRSRTASTNWRAVPSRKISAAIQTLLSMTSRSTFIREQLVEYVFVHTLGRGMLGRALRGPAQTFACHTLAALSGLRQLPEPDLGFQGRDAFHNGQNSYSGRNGRE